MKKITALIIALAMALSHLCAVAAETNVKVSAQRAFSWNYTTNKQNGNLPTSVSWGDYRACFMKFEIPEEILLYKEKDARITAVLSADMSFNNGRKSGQAPIVTIISADGDTIGDVSLTGGSDTSERLRAAVEMGNVLGTINTLTEDVSTALDITDAVMSGKTSVGLYLTCRSEDGYFKTNGIVNFNSPTLDITAREVDDAYRVESIYVPYNIEEGYTLPEKIYGKEIKWSDTVEAEDGTVYKTITASVGNETKDFDVMVMGKKDEFVLAYTTDESVASGKSMHLAVKGENGWEKLNFNIGVLFATADMHDGNIAGTTKVLEKPYIYRKDDGKIQVAARCMTTAGVKDDFYTIWETPDLCAYTVAGTVDKVEGYETVDRITADIDNASCIFPVTAEEKEYLVKKLGEVKNTDVETIRIDTAVGEAVYELPNLIANYSDGSKGEIPVIWNMNELEEIDFTKQGMYKVTGEAVAFDYPSPMIYEEADPCITKFNGKYYFIATNDKSGVDLEIRCSDTIAGLADAEEMRFFTHTETGDHSSCNWAPELHIINGELYCLFASSTGGGWSGVQSRIIKCSGDPMRKESWGEPVRIMKKDGSFLMEAGIILDMTYFEAGGKHYYCWAERKITSEGNGHGYISIAQMDPEDPYRIQSDPVMIREADYGWDRRTSPINEGPFALKHNGKVYLTFSGSGVGDTYCVGMMTADEDADLTLPESWKITNYPVLESNHVEHEYGPGHNSFTKDEYGRDVIVFHIKRDRAERRSTTARVIHYGFDGTPLFYMTADRYLKKEYRNVTAYICVRDEGMTDEEFEVESIANNIRIYNADNIKEHITLPTEMDGALIEWFSEDGCITSDGIVTRGMSDKKVKLTAKISKNNLSKVREFDVIVKAKSEEKVPAGYIYAYFRGNVNGEEEIQQIHLAISRDGLNWKDMNGNRPIITSDMGTKGIRDPYIIRSYENDKFYLMATDLDANGKVWSEVAVEGSRYLMFWESDDLINWSEQRMVRISEDYMGCTWAPEAIYDEENKQYVMYWASSDLNDNGRKKIYYCTTRDFRSFTKPELYIDHTDFQIIDTTMIKGDDGRYYRFTKREDEISVYLEVGNSPLGKFTKIDSNIENVKGVEGPAIFTLPDGKYCLMLDGYTRSNKGVGFFPLVSDDIAGGKFTRLTSGYSMPTGAKHGVMLAVTEEEYEAIVEKWGPEVPCEHGSAPDLEFFFDDDETGYKLFGNARIEDGKLILDGNTGTYAELEKGVFNRRDTFSVSMDVLSNMESGYFFTFGIGNDTNDYFYLRIRGNQVRLAQTISGNSYEERITYDAASGFNEQWHNYVIVGNPDGLRLYIDGVMAGSLETKKHSGILEMTLEFILENPPSRKTSTSTEALIM